jgi:hypothetical protein
MRGLAAALHNPRQQVCEPVAQLLLNLRGYGFRIEGNTVGEKLELDVIGLRVGRLRDGSDLLERCEG